MKIELEQTEIISIITNWAKTKYGTHNVSIEYLGDNGKGYTTATLAITMADNDFNTNAIKIADSKFGELVKQMKHKSDIGDTAFAGDSNEPVYSPMSCLILT